MDIENLSTSSLLLLHSPVRQALETDDNLPDGQKIHEAREEPDWRRWSDRIEAELDKRNAKYEKIEW